MRLVYRPLRSFPFGPIQHIDPIRLLAYITCPIRSAPNPEAQTHGAASRRRRRRRPRRRAWARWGRRPPSAQGCEVGWCGRGGVAVRVQPSRRQLKGPTLPHTVRIPVPANPSLSLSPSLTIWAEKRRVAMPCVVDTYCLYWEVVEYIIILLANPNTTCLCIALRLLLIDTWVPH